MASRTKGHDGRLIPAMTVIKRSFGRVQGLSSGGTRCYPALRPRRASGPRAWSRILVEDKLCNPWELFMIEDRDGRL